ncbi:unnamed protein product [Scytosiphon promiscuus]
MRTERKRRHLRQAGEDLLVGKRRIAAILDRTNARAGPHHQQSAITTLSTKGNRSSVRVAVQQSRESDSLSAESSLSLGWGRAVHPKYLLRVLPDPFDCLKRVERCGTRTSREPLSLSLDCS